jgi:ABC-2 type transport system ATP-binding protein
VAVVEVERLTKRFGAVEAVRDLSFSAEAGRVTGFLGPNGAGKSTTLRVLLGLVRATEGSATFGGRRYDELEEPSRRVGAVLEDTAFHPGRSGRNHLRVLAAAGRHPAARVDELLELVGIADAGRRRVKTYSLGMRQRLGIAAALLGDPEVLVLDEPANGLDPPGIRWLRGLLRDQAASGRAVLVSSHVLAEVAQSVDDVVVIAHGRLRAAGPLETVLGAGDRPRTTVRSLDPDGLAAALGAAGHRVQRESADRLVVEAPAEQVGRVAADERIVLVELGQRTRTLEEAFFALTHEDFAGAPEKP